MKKLSLLLIIAMFSNVANATYVNPPVPVSKGGTGSTSQTASRAATTDSSGHIVSTSATTDTEIGYVHGLSSAVQTQLNGKASLALDNIASVALSADLICATSGSCKLGSAAKPFGDSYFNLLKDASGVKSIDVLGRGLFNTSGTSVLDFSGASAKAPSFAIAGSTSGAVTMATPAITVNHTVTLPADKCSAGQYWADNGSGVMSCTSVVSPVETVVDGGNADYTIGSGDGHVRSGTTLTGSHAYTLPACTAGNIGEKHSVKNLPAQTFPVVLTADGSDNIDGAASVVLNPGDAMDVQCSAFASSGTWDIR